MLPFDHKYEVADHLRDRMTMAGAWISTRALRPAPLAGRQRRGALCIYQWVNETLDSSVSAKNSRTKHSMVKDAKVGKPLHSGGKKRNTQGNCRKMQLVDFFSELFALSIFLWCLPQIPTRQWTFANCLEEQGWMEHSHKPGGWGSYWCHCQGCLDA